MQLINLVKAMLLNNINVDEKDNSTTCNKTILPKPPSFLMHEQAVCQWWDGSILASRK